MNGVTTSAVQCAQFREYPLKKFDPARGTLNAVSLRVQRLLMWDVYLSSAQTPRYVYDMIWFLVQAQLFSIASAGGYTIIQDTGVQRRDIADAWYDPYSSVRTYVATEFFDFGDTTFNTPGDLVLADFVGTGNALTRRSWRDGVVHSEVGSGSFGSGTNAQFLVRLELEYRYTPTGATIPVLTE